MVFSSSTFIFVFLPVSIIGYYLLHPRYRNTFLLLVSLFFYAWGEPKFVFVMIASISINWVAALLIERNIFRGKNCKGILALSVGINLLLLVVFKYLNFMLNNLNKIAAVFPQTSIALPIGISFFTFQAISYLIDIYRGKGAAQKNILNVGLYISFFPQLIAGPIVRYESIAAEIRGRETSWDDFCIGIERFLKGLFKKILLSNNMAIVADAAFGAPIEGLSMSMAWFGALCYTMQIYFDFSGYSDMAIGLGRIFGFHFNENFNYPYISRSVTEFWRRWHISLGTWFRDYVYFPMGGSRVETRGKHIFNLFVVWLLTGLWHGANWTFIVWGLLYFALLVAEKFVIHPEKFGETTISRWGWQTFTMLSVILGWVVFRSTDFSHSIQYCQAMFGIGVPFVNGDATFYIREYTVLFAISVMCCTPTFSRLKELAENKGWTVAAECVKVIVFFVLMLLSVSYLVMGAHNPFIYFNF